VCVSEGTDAHLLGTSLMAMSDVAAVNISQDDMERFSSMMGSMDLIVVVIILCAAGLAEAHTNAFLYSGSVFICSS